MIKFDTRKVIQVQDWDELVRGVYGKVYSFQQQDGCKDRGVYDFEIPQMFGEDDYQNDSVPEVVNGEEMGVSFKSWLEREPTQPIPNQTYDWQLNMFWERNFYPDVSMIIEDLHKRGILEEGKYTINIDW